MKHSNNHYGFRIYNPRIAKFLSVDPLTKSYPMLTPYQFASNRPIDGIDLDGLEFYKQGTFFDFEMKKAIFNDKNVLVAVRDQAAINNNSFNQMSKGNKTSFGFENTRNGISAINDLFNDSKGELWSTVTKTGKVFVRFGRVTAGGAIVNQVLSDLENINKKAKFMNEMKVKGKYENDEIRVQWFGEFLNDFNKSEQAKQLKFGSEQEVLEFINFAFDGKKPYKNSGTEFNGMEIKVFDSSKKDRFEEMFQKMLNYYNENKANVPKPEDE